MPSRDYVRWMRETPGMAMRSRRLGVGESPAAIASGVEFLLEGLHLHRRLNKERTGGGVAATAPERGTGPTMTSPAPDAATGWPGRWSP